MLVTLFLLFYLWHSLDNYASRPANVGQKHTRDCTRQAALVQLASGIGAEFTKPTLWHR